MKLTRRTAGRLYTSAMCAAGCAMLMCTPSWAALELSTDPWSGRWRDAQGGELIVLAAEGVLDVHGTDTGSIYRLLCIVDAANPRLAQCSGDGLNRERTPFRFIYRSQWKLSAEGTLSEDWQAHYFKGQLSGKAEFRRLSAPAGTR